MKRMLFICALLLSLSACKFETQYGPCIGAFEEGDPKLVYQISPWNTVWAIIGIEMVLPPILWLVSCGKCPEGEKR